MLIDIIYLVEQSTIFIHNFFIRNTISLFNLYFMRAKQHSI